MRTGSVKQYRAFVARIAKLNNVSTAEVERYFNALNGRGRITRHLDLGA